MSEGQNILFLYILILFAIKQRGCIFNIKKINLLVLKFYYYYYTITRIINMIQ